MARVYLNFGGFYATEHGKRVEAWINPDWDDYKNIYDWNEAYRMYGQYYVEWFNSLFDTNLEFVSIWKPETFYMQVESIEVSVNERDASLLRDVAYTEFGDDYFLILNRAVRSRAGYLAEDYYLPIEQAMDRRLECVLDCLLEKLEADWDTYYYEVVVPQIPEEEAFQF
ncbi:MULTISPECIES: hypothetical protein [Neisseria]|uniref:Uncharacterized protein n=1 Tax=Neisseria brasiliensis TaxID=2666100 RepID=A0A7X2GZG8_9NEIS|nr:MULTISPECIES: hypothetical protein [Neisseria]MRN38587.1 hypothetical protein [Neisseria brasiliensis]